ncbi:hypothetical protein KAU09_00025 [Candidatus Parcubacteria bacterium]|nr:hypothetical protein [Candidatus Parcubacteria bacterium]
MKIIKIQFIVLTLALLVNPVFAQKNNNEEVFKTIQFGEYTVEYNSSEKINQNYTIYKKEGRIVLSVFDTDKNGKDDLWLRYNENFVLDLEASDTNKDGKPDTFAILDTEENVIDLKTPNFVLEKVVLPKNPNPKQKILQTKVVEPEIFILGTPPTKNKFNFPIKWIITILAIGAAVFFGLRNRKRNKR